jgi:hypothetical protein
VRWRRVARRSIPKEKEHEVPCTNAKDVSPFIAAEARRIAELRAAGTITGVWLKSDFSGAVLMVECADETEATAALNTLPIVINEATAYVLTEIVDLDSLHPWAAWR